MNWTPYLSIWSVFAAVVLGLAIYRRKLALGEDGTLHVAEGTSKLMTQQAANAQRIEVVEKWGKSLTAVVVVAGLVLAAIYFYGVWQNGSTATITR